MAETPRVDRNTVTVSADGPLYVRGNIEMVMPTGTTLHRDALLKLCRCGASKTKPICDDSHINTTFRDAGALGENRVRVEEGIETAGYLRITPSPNGSLKLLGEFELRSSDGQTIHQGNRVSLCRCGGSKNKPFCDSTHRTNGFEAM